MATKKTTASQPGKKGVPAKKAIPAKKTVATKKAESKKAVKPAAKKAIAVKKVTATKAAPAKKTKTTSSPKAQPAKAAKKAVVKPAKAAVAKKSTAAKAATKSAKTTKPVAGKTPAPAKTKAVSTKKAAAPVEIAKPVKKSIKKENPKPEAKEKKSTKKEVAAPTRRKEATPIPVVPARSEIVDAVRPLPRKTTSKPGVIIAHRKIEKKASVEPGLTMKEYNPSVRSLLDEPEQNSGPVYRYSDEELNEFKELIIKRLDNARKELAYLQGLITRKDEAGTDDTDNRFNHMEDGSGAMEREQLSQLAGRQIQFINHLEKALIRIENKTYGICRVTGKLIDKARLRAVPHATLSIEAKNEMNK